MFRCLIVLAAPLAALGGSDSPAEFSQTRTMADVRSLAALKSRIAGTNGEPRAIRYVKEKLAAQDLMSGQNRSFSAPMISDRAVFE